jgi:hypothetical protein
MAPTLWVRFDMHLWGVLRRKKVSPAQSRSLDHQVRHRVEGVKTVLDFYSKECWRGMIVMRDGHRQTDSFLQRAQESTLDA